MTESPSNSALGDVLEDALEASSGAFEYAKAEAMKGYFVDAASENTILTGSAIQKDVVLSTHIQKMVNAYKARAVGGVVVVCSPPDSGKTHAAEYLIHGDYLCRPSRALKVTARGMENFPAEFALAFDAEKLEQHLATTLCQALAPNRGSKQENLNQFGKDTRQAALAVRFPTVALDIDSPLKVYGKEQLPVPTVEFLRTGVFERLPMLIIDDFNKRTKENLKFVEELLQDSAETGIFVFILTKDPAWATELVQLNGGRKIKPLVGNVDNKNYEQGKKLVGIPRWNELPWSLRSLQDLVRPLYPFEGSVEEIIPALAPPVTRFGRLVARFRKAKPPTPLDAIDDAKIAAQKAVAREVANEDSS